MVLMMTIEFIVNDANEYDRQPPIYWWEKNTLNFFFGWLTSETDTNWMGKKQIKRKYQAKAAADKKLSHV